MAELNRDTQPGDRKRAGGTGIRVATSLPPTIEVLGVDAENRIYIYARDIQQVFIVQNLRDIDGGLMVLMAGMDGVDQTVSYRPLIAAAARKRRYRDGDMIGAGVHAVPGVDGVVVNLSDRAFRVIVDGYRAGIIEIESPMIGGKLLVPSPSAAHFPSDELRSEIAYAAGDESRGRDALDAYERAFACYHYLTGDAAQLASTSAAAVLAGTLPFRPLIWISGATNSGKTATLETIAQHFPYALRMEGASTEAALRQSIGRDSVPVLFDEFEPSPARARVIAMLRSTSHGGEVVKGSPSGRPIRFSLRSIVFAASIDVDLRRDADRNRFIIFELGPSQTPIIVPKGPDTAALGRRLAAAVIVAAPEVVRRYLSLSTHPAVREFGRSAEAHAVGVAVRATLRGWTEADAIDVLRSILAAHRGAMEGRCDSEFEALVRDIATSRVSLSDQTWTIGELILAGIGREHDLHRLGIKSTQRGIFLAPDLIQRHLLQHTRWSDTNIGDVLARVPGAQRSRHRLGEGINVRGVEVPLSRFFDIASGPRLAKDGGDAAA